MRNEYTPKCRHALKGYGHVQLISSVMRYQDFSSFEPSKDGKLADSPPVVLIALVAYLCRVIGSLVAEGPFPKQYVEPHFSVPFSFSGSPAIQSLSY